MEAPRPVVVREPGTAPCSWEASLDAAASLEVGRDLSAADRAVLREVDCALVDGTGRDPVRLANLVHRAEPPLQVVVVAPDQNRLEVKRAVLFAPGLGEIWVVGPHEVGPDLVARANTVTRQRRTFRATHARLEHDLAGIEPRAARRAVISDAYLASLLAVLPDPVLSIDHDNRILSWNPAAERVLGHTRSAAVGQPLGDVLAPEDPSGLARLLETVSTVPSGGEIRFRSSNGEEGFGEIVIVPVEAGGHRVRAVVLHDVTEERRAHEALTDQAAELEAQATELEAAQLEMELVNDDLQRANQELGVRTDEAEQARRAADAAREAAERARSEAEAANRAKSEFLATMSHEIRTPINAIIGYTDLLDMGLAGPVTAKQTAQLERIRASSRHLLGLIEDILDLAKVEAGRMQVAQERALVVPAISAAVALVSPQAVEKGIHIEDPCAEDPGTQFVGDEHRVRQILTNLLSNAVKFTEPGGRIWVTCGTTHAERPAAEAPAGPWTYIRVSDTGIGIVRGEIERIFRPFEQVEQGRTRTYGGSGLGLTISRQLARLMGGDLTVESERGVGSTFTLWLPGDLAALPPAEEPAPARRNGERAGAPAAVGKALSRGSAAIFEAFRDRLRGDPAVPTAARLEDAELEDHLPTLLADVAQNLAAMDRSTLVPEPLLRAGGEIQRVISSLHGAQRGRQGWTEAAVRREFAILREEAEAGARRELPAGVGDADGALELLGRMLEQAERISLAGLRGGRAEEPTDARSGRTR